MTRLAFLAAGLTIGAALGFTIGQDIRDWISEQLESVGVLTEDRMWTEAEL